MFWLSAQTPRIISAFVFLLCHTVPCSGVSNCKSACCNEVVPHMTRALGGTDAFQFALQELGNNKDEEEESLDEDEESRGFDVSLLEYCTILQVEHTTPLPVLAVRQT
jgi:hypothetical protein